MILPQRKKTFSSLHFPPELWRGDAGAPGSTLHSQVYKCGTESMTRTCYGSSLKHMMFFPLAVDADDGAAGVGDGDGGAVAASSSSIRHFDSQALALGLAERPVNAATQPRSRSNDKRGKPALCQRDPAALRADLGNAELNVVYSQTFPRFVAT